MFFHASCPFPFLAPFSFPLAPALGGPAFSTDTHHSPGPYVRLLSSHATLPTTTTTLHKDRRRSVQASCFRVLPSGRRTRSVVVFTPFPNQSAMVDCVVGWGGTLPA